MLVAEDLLILLTHEGTGRHLVGAPALDLGLAGGVLAELVMLGAVEVTRPGGPTRAGLLVARRRGPLGDPVLDEALRRVEARGARRPQDVLSPLSRRLRLLEARGACKPQDALAPVSRGLRRELLGRLVARGVLRAEEGRVLGIVPVRRWPAVDGARAHGLRAGLRDVLVVGRTPTPREAALVGLLSGVGAVPKVVTGAPARELRRRARAIAADEFAGAAVGRAVQAVGAAVAAGAATIAVVSGASGG